MDPLGADVGTSDPYVTYGTPSYSDLLGSQPLYSERGNALDQAGGCALNGVAIDCGFAMELLESDGAVECPNGDCGPQARRVPTSDGGTFTYLSTPFIAFSNGVSGYFMPSSLGMGTPQEWAEWIYLGATRGNRGGNLDLPRANGGGSVMFFAPQKAALNQKYLTPPKLQGKPTPQQTDAFNKAYGLFADRLQNHSGCGEFFGGAEAALKALHRMKIRFADLGGPTQLYRSNELGLTGAQLDPKSLEMEINTQGQFMGVHPDLGYEGVKPPLTGAIILAHEVAHVLGKIPLDGDFGDGAIKSEDNTWKVIQACFRDDNGAVN